mgnify:CR=1 FL=1
MKINDKDLTLKKRAKTFYFASFFLPQKTREDIEILYIFRELVHIADFLRYAQRGFGVPWAAIPPGLHLNASSELGSYRM